MKTQQEESTKQTDSNKRQFQKQKDDRLRYLIFFGLLFLLFVHSFIKHGILNQIIALIIPKVSAQVAFVNSPSGFIPDWSRLRFSEMRVEEDGEVTYPTNRGNQTRTWRSGQSIAEFLELGDFEETELQIENLNLSTISRRQGLNLNRLKLGDFQLTKWQTLPNLVRAIPSLRNRPVRNVRPISDLLRRNGISGNTTIGNASRNPRVRNLQLGRINLNNYSLTSIPDIQNTSINRFSNWQDSRINGVPGLSDLTWDNFPGLNTLDLSFIGKVDLVLREIEANRTRSISGSYQEGFNVPCLQTNCAHGEMSGIGRTTGVQWISGKYQKVRGGFGILGRINGGKEPTGRHPFGSAFKQVVWDINESQGEMETTIFFRICKHIPFGGRTCTPYFIGPVPFIVYKEKDPIIFGNPASLP